LREAIDGTSRSIAGLRDELIALRQQESAAAVGDQGTSAQQANDLREAIDGTSRDIAGLRDELLALRQQERAVAVGDPAATGQQLNELRAAVEGTNQSIAALRDELFALKHQQNGAIADRAPIDEASARFTVTADAMHESINRLASVVDSLSRFATSFGQRPKSNETAPVPDKAGSQALLSELRELISDADVANLYMAGPPGKRGGGTGA
jgi:chromosome segregation ATPase